MSQILPKEGFLRLRQILGSPKADPPEPPIIPISRSQWLLNVKNYPESWPQPINLGPRTVVYRVEDIRALLCASTPGYLQKEEARLMGMVRQPEQGLIDKMNAAERLIDKMNAAERLSERIQSPELQLKELASKITKSR